MNLETIGG